LLVRRLITELSAWEFKWNPRTNYRFPNTFLDGYRPVATEVVTPDNFEEFLTA